MTCAYIICAYLNCYWLTGLASRITSLSFFTVNEPERLYILVPFVKTFVRYLGL